MSADKQVTTDVKLASAGEPIRITFEPLGDAFELGSDEFILLRVAPAALTSLEIYIWPNGISVWLPYPGDSDYIILNSAEEEICRF